jgi:hypothetical protein
MTAKMKGTSFRTGKMSFFAHGFVAPVNRAVDKALHNNPNTVDKFHERFGDEPCPLCEAAKAKYSKDVPVVLGIEKANG